MKFPGNYIGMEHDAYLRERRYQSRCPAAEPAEHQKPNTILLHYVSSIYLPRQEEYVVDALL